MKETDIQRDTLVNKTNLPLELRGLTDGIKALNYSEIMGQSRGDRVFKVVDLILPDLVDLMRLFDVEVQKQPQVEHLSYYTDLSNQLLVSLLTPPAERFLDLVDVENIFYKGTEPTSNIVSEIVDTLDSDHLILDSTFLRPILNDVLSVYTMAPLLDRYYTILESDYVNSIYKELEAEVQLNHGFERVLFERGYIDEIDSVTLFSILSENISEYSQSLSNRVYLSDIVSNLIDCPSNLFKDALTNDQERLIPELRDYLSTMYDKFPTEVSAKDYESIIYDKFPTEVLAKDYEAEDSSRGRNNVVGIMYNSELKNLVTGYCGAGVDSELDHLLNLSLEVARDSECMYLDEGSPFDCVYLSDAKEIYVGTFVTLFDALLERLRNVKTIEHSNEGVYNLSSSEYKVHSGHFHVDDYIDSRLVSDTWEGEKEIIPRTLRKDKIFEALKEKIPFVRDGSKVYDGWSIEKKANLGKPIFNVFLDGVDRFIKRRKRMKIDKQDFLDPPIKPPEEKEKKIWLIQGKSQIWHLFNKRKTR